MKIPRSTGFLLCVAALFAVPLSTADGAVLTVASDKLQANYEGGDGNDLVLIVIP